MPKIRIIRSLFLMIPFRLWMLFKGKKKAGYTLFVPTGVSHEYPVVDLKEQKVIGVVTYKKKVYMKVYIDVREDTVTVEGSVDELRNLGMSKESFIDMFKSEAVFFIENNIANPAKCYEEVDQRS